MDERTDPCNDFYRYSCGGWLKQNQLREFNSRLISSTTALETHLDRILQEIIQENVPVLHEFWESCMAKSQLTQLDNKPLQNDLDRISKAQTKSQVMELAGEFARTGGSVFVKFKVVPDPMNIKINTLRVQPELTLPHNVYYSDKTILKAYANYIQQVMLLGMTDLKRKRGTESDVFHRHAKIVIQMEQNVLVIQERVRQSIDPLNMERSIQLWPNIFQEYMKGMRLLENNPHINDQLTIYGSFEYLHHVEKMIQEKLSLEELKMYIQFRMIHSRVQWLEDRYNIAWFALFRRELNAQPRRRPRDKICRERLQKYLPDLVGHRFYTKVFDREKKTKVFDMFKLIRDAMEQGIRRMRWLDDKSEREKDLMNTLLEALGGPINPVNEKSEMETASDKLHKLEILIGQTKSPRSWPSKLSRDDYPANMYNILSHSFDQDMMKVGQRRNFDEWPVSSMEINAHYLPDRNAIVLPAGVLQPPLFYGSSVHPARNFGAIGAIIGHEMIHAFDAKGSLYDADGNEFPWWDPTKKDFTDRAQCFERAYFILRVSGDNSQNTLDENIADNGGVALAWDAYRKYMTTVKPNTNGITAEQGEKLFFLAFGQMWCERSRNRVFDDQIRKSSFGKLRVHAVVRNSMNFAKTFQCEEFTPMNPSEKCALW